MDTSGSDDGLPEEILAASYEASLNLLPAKSKIKYEKQYSEFIDWCNSKKVQPRKEEVFSAYFLEMSKIWRPNTLWSRYSMIKSVCKLKQDLDIGKFHKLTAFIKRQNIGFRPKKAKTFNEEEITKFMSEASDEIYLMMKLVTIFGLAGACRREELTKLTIDDIDDKGDLIIVNIKDSKNPRSFVISQDTNNGYFLNIYRKYMNLRPKEIPHRRIFIKYNRGKCKIQPVGINTIGKIPSEIAAYLRLQNPELYTGHSFRRSSATFLANCGEGITNIKRLGGWKSTAVAEGYLEESINQKKKISTKILNLNGSSTSNCNTESLPSKEPSNNMMASIQRFASSSSNCNTESLSAKEQLTSTNMMASAINLHNATNCTFTINITNN